MSTAARTRHLISDPDEIRRAMEVYLPDGRVTEIRALDATVNGDRYVQTYSGYFNDRDKLIDAVGEVTSAKAVYFIPNEINPALLARAVNRLRPAKKDPLTSDGNVTRRCWLPIDADAVRPAGISASDDEHAAALARVEDIARDLTLNGWYAGVRGDSGNGGHLTYAIDLPAEDSGLVQRCLDALAKEYSDDVVKIDTSVFNPARIWKLYGTRAGKGDDAGEECGRPHRMARLISVPDAITPIPVELLEDFASRAPKPEAPPPNRGKSKPVNGHSFNIAEWLRDHRVPVDGPEPWSPKNGGSGNRWIFPTCPWNSDHTNRSAFVLQMPSGAVEAGCHHEGCKGRDWHSLRNIFEPGWDRSRQSSDKRQKSTTKNQVEEALDNAPLSSRNITDVGNSGRFTDHSGADFRFCYPRNAWLAFSGPRWEWDEAGRVIDAGKKTAVSIHGEAQEAHKAAAAAQAHGDEQGAARHATRANALAKWAIQSQRRDRIMAMLTLAQPDLAIGLDALDADPWAFNTAGGTLDLHNGREHHHRREDLITRLSPVRYNRDALCPLWDRVLHRIFGGDAALISYIQRLAGMWLTADVGVQELPVFYGAGGNGKSVFLDTISGIMGDYAGIAPESLVTMRSNAEHPTELAGLAGDRLIVASETEAGATLRLQLVKRLTGDAALTARFMRGDYFEFKRTFHVVLVTNNRPRIPETTEAAWRRIRLVPFNVVIPPEERDPHLLAKLRDEWPGILAWMVRGCLAWQRDGLGTPPAVEKATGTYRAEQDAIGEYIAERCSKGDRLKAYAGELYADYSQWTEAAGEHPVSQRRFGDELGKRGYVSERCTYSNRRMWTGLGLRSRQDDVVEGV